jgi:5-methylthioadenosine/S-adenosylhomocysteine deaminase
MALLIKGTSLISSKEERSLLQNINIIIEEENIVWIGNNEIPVDYSISEVIDGRNKLLIPGLIDPHTHSQHALQKGRIPITPIEMWMPLATAAGGELSEREAYISAMTACIDHLRCGTTTILDHFAGSQEALEGTIRAYQDAGIRANIAPIISDIHFHKSLSKENILEDELLVELQKNSIHTSKKLLDDCEQRLKQVDPNDSRIRMFIGPSNPIRCSDELLAGCADLAERYDTCIHSHLHETRWSALAAREIYGTTLVERMAELDFLSSRCSFAHGVWLTDKEMNILAENNVSIVHLPWSNLWLGSGIANLFKLKSTGVPIAIGTDGMSGGTNSNMFDAIRLTADLHHIKESDDNRWFSAHDVLKMATQTAAQAVRSMDQIGSVEVGKKADLVLLDLNTTTFKPLNDALLQLVHYENGSSVNTVIVGGDVVVKDGHITTFNEQEILEEAQEIVSALLARTKIDYQFAQKVQQQYRKYYQSKIKEPPVSGILDDDDLR